MSNPRSAVHVGFPHPTARWTCPAPGYPNADYPAARVYLIGRRRSQADCGNSLIDDDIRGKALPAQTIGQRIWYIRPCIGH